MQEVHAVYTGSNAAPEIERSLGVSVRAYGTQRGGLAEHIEEAVEGALRDCAAGAAGIAFDRDADARLSDQLFRARRVGFTKIAIRLSALRALCAPVGGLDAADAKAIAFYVQATRERPVTLEIDEADRQLPAFVIARPLEDVINETVDDDDAEEEQEEVVSMEAASVSLAQVIAMGDESVADEIVETASEEVVEAESEVAEAVAPIDPTNGRWKVYVDALEAARGPQTLASFEKLFTQSYLPLADALDRGFVEPRASDAREEFRRTFARAYSEALPTFALTGKRPRMVLDAYDLAAKMARAHGARSAQILLVDGMRFDLAARISARSAELLEGRASLADRVTLFSALPSTTPRQLEVLARGAEALRTAHDDSREAEPTRGRTADSVRRVRVGSRDLYKLDIVETTLAAAGDVREAMDTLVEDAARAIAKHARAQSSRTLLFVMGDHGFRLDRGAAKHGGASPEEVIVSAHAFLVGDLH